MPEHDPSDIPPIQQGEFEVPQAPPSWPKVIGVVCIVLGALGVLGGLWQAVAPLLMEAMLGSLAQTPEMKATIQVQKDHMVWLLLAALLGIAGAIMLLIGGAGLCMQRRWGHMMLKVYIPFRIVVVVLASVLTWVVTEATHKAMATSGTAPPLSSAVLVVSLAFGLAWGWAMPVFLWIWFSRSKVKALVSAWE